MGDLNFTEAGIPQHGQFALPLLKVLSDRAERARADMVAETLDKAQVPKELRDLRYEKSGFHVAANRIAWAQSELIRAQLIAGSGRGPFRITDAGMRFLAEHPDGFAKADLEALPAWSEYVPKRRVSADLPGATEDATSALATPLVDDQTPDERIDDAIGELEDEIKSRLLARLKEGDPRFLEVVVRRLLVKMGFGKEGQLKKLKGPGDSGIDGVVDRDELGLSRIYIQAKRYNEAIIGREVVQAFIGALATRGASTGVFFTTSRFSEGAVDAAERVAQDIALVDGLRLVELMVKHRVGVQVDRTIEVVKFDEDFFE